MNTFLKLYACCIATKGAKRSIISDLQRNKIVFIPNSLFDIIKLFDNNSIEYVKNIYKNNENNTINSYIDFIINNDFGFFCEENEVNLFPKMNLYWNEPSIITNAIIDFDIKNNHKWDNIISQLESLGCKHIQIRSYDFDDVYTNDIEDIIIKFESTIILSIDLIVPYTESINYDNLIKKFHRLNYIAIHGSPDDIVKDKLFYIKNKIKNSDHCGIISPQYFSINIKNFTESQKYNSCLNRKISIDTNGNIKNCPSIQKDYGNIKDTSLHSALAKKGFKDLWEINKDQIEVCKDCEFRYICTDCRAFIDKPDDKYSKPSKCSYNPYTTSWQ